MLVQRELALLNCGLVAVRHDLVHLCSLCIADQDLSHIVEDEAYDYKFVKWMIKEKVI